MTRHDEGEWVMRTRASDRAHRLRTADGGRHLGITFGLPVRDLHQMLNNFTSEPGDQTQVKWKVERRALAREVFCNLGSRNIQAVGSTQNQWTNLLGQLLQNLIEALGVEGDSHQSDARRAEQQLANR